jgi:hypothetical protein
MGHVVLAMSMSLDGYIAGPNVGVEQLLGQCGERLHDWMFVGKTEREAEVFEAGSFKTTGAIIRVSDCSIISAPSRLCWNKRV